MSQRTSKRSYAPPEFLPSLSPFARNLWQRQLKDSEELFTYT